jgi:transcriptional regulator with XRE-family HTH domain
MDTFGALLRKWRIQAGFGLRKFAELVDMMPSNLSAIENGRRVPPADEDKLREIALALGLVEDSTEWSTFFDASKRNGALPADVRRLADRKLVPALLRTIDNCQLTDEQIAGLIDEISERHKEKRP